MTRRMKWMTFAAVLAQLLVYPSIYVVLFYVTSERLHSLSKPLIRELTTAIQAINKHPFACDLSESTEGQRQRGALTTSDMTKFDVRILHADSDFLEAAISPEIAEFTHAVLALNLDVARGVLYMNKAGSELSHFIFGKSDYQEICELLEYAETDTERREIAEASQVAIQAHKAKLADFLERFQAASAEHASRRWAIAAIAWLDILFEIVGFTCGVLVIRQWRRDRKAKRASAGQTGPGA